MTLAEAVPAVPFAGAGVIAALGLLAFLGYLLATGMLKAWDETLGTFIRWLADKIDVSIHVWHSPSVHPLRSLSHGLYAVDKQVRNAFAALALRSENAAAWCFTTAGIIFRWSVKETADLAHDVFGALQRTTVETIPSAIRRAQADTLARLRGIDHAVGRLEAQARAQLKRLQVGIDRMEHRITFTLTHSIAGVRSRLGAVERWEHTATKDLAKLKTKTGTIAMTTAVALALSRLGLNWLRCPSLGRVGRKVGCKGFAALEDLLALSFDAILLSDLCALTTLITKAANVAAPVIDHLAEGIGGLIRCQNATRPRALSVNWSAPPPVVTSIEL
jgi:hypothetical protein